MKHGLSIFFKRKLCFLLFLMLYVVSGSTHLFVVVLDEYKASWFHGIGFRL